MIRIDGFEFQPVNRGEGVSWKVDYGRKIIVFHRTEGSHRALSQTSGPVSTYLTAPEPGADRVHCPHGTLSPRFDQAWQHISLDLGSNWTARDRPGGVETSDARWTVQFEVTGFTDDGPGDLTTAEWEWMGEKFAQVAKAMNASRLVFVDDVIPNCTWVNRTDGFVAKVDADQRMTFDQWKNTLADEPEAVLIVGHCHIPENVHYDPGRLDKEAMFRGAAGVFGEGFIVTPEDLQVLKDLEARLMAAIQATEERMLKLPIGTPWAGAGKTTPLGDVLTFILRNVAGIYLGEPLKGTSVENPNAFWPDEVRASLRRLEDQLPWPDVNKAKVVQAVVVAVNDLQVQVDAEEMAEGVARHLPGPG